MQIAYDKTVDALSVTLRRGIVARTLEIAPEILLDFDKKENPLYLEILGAREKVGEKNFSTVKIGSKSFTLPTLALPKRA